MSGGDIGRLAGQASGLAGGCGPWRAVVEVLKSWDTGPGKLCVLVAAGWIFVVSPAAVATATLLEGLEINFLIGNFDGSDADSGLPWQAVLVVLFCGPAIAWFCIYQRRLWEKAV